MKYMTVGNELKEASQLILGCMRLAEHDPKEVVSVLEAALEVGINFFDHSDVYAGGQSEAKFAQALRSAKIPRDRVLILPSADCGMFTPTTILTFLRIISSARLKAAWSACRQTIWMCSSCTGRML